MILLTQTQTLVLQLIHHPVKHLHDAVCFSLTNRSQTAAEILFTQQVHSTCNAIERFYNFTIKIEQDYQAKRNHTFSHI